MTTARIPDHQRPGAPGVVRVGLEPGAECGARVPPRTPWDQQRETLASALRGGAPGGTWSARYTLRRFAWHVLDHAWEIEDRST